MGVVPGPGRDPVRLYREASGLVNCGRAVCDLTLEEEGAISAAVLLAHLM